MIAMGVMVAGCEKIENTANIQDNNNLYITNDEGHVHDLRLTVVDAASNQLTNGMYTFDELNTLDGKFDGKDIKVSGILKEYEDGESVTGLLGYGITDANVVIEQRGQSARLFDQKSYKMSLVEEGGLFYGHQIINANKHVEDETKIINKLCFDLLKKTDRLLSLETMFINLNIKDLNQPNPTLVDYGLFTHVEQIDSLYLEKRGLDKKGYLYKVINYEFYENSDVLMNKDDPNYDKDEFEKLIEIKGKDNHEKLLNLINDVNNPLIPINDTIDRYLNRENYLSWLATNILFGNVDTASGNYYLYSSRDAEPWYFISWDFDKSLTAYADRANAWQMGVSNYWGSALHQRFLMNDENRNQLTYVLEDLYQNVYNETNITELTNQYKPILTTSFQKSPDALPQEEIDEIFDEIDSIPDVITKNRENYYLTLQKPLPFFLGAVINRSTYISVNWSESYDFQQQRVYYDLTIARDSEFNDIVFEQTDIEDTEAIVEGLEPDTYFYKVTSRDTDGNTQMAFDFYIDRVTNLYYPGIKQFIID